MKNAIGDVRSPTSGGGLNVEEGRDLSSRNTGVSTLADVTSITVIMSSMIRAAHADFCDPPFACSVFPVHEEKPFIRGKDRGGQVFSADLDWPALLRNGESAWNTWGRSDSSRVKR